VRETPVRACIALGSNLGDRRAHLMKALELLANLPHTRVLRVSSWYENPAVDIEGGHDFLNGVAEVETLLPPGDLLKALQQIETLCGRIRSGEGFQNRTLDLDLLLYGEEHILESGLIVPHPRMWERDFVRIPLEELGITSGKNPL